MYTVVTKCRRVVACASAPTNTQGSGQSVNGWPAALSVPCVRVRRGQRFQVDDVIRNADPVVAEIIGGLGDLDDFAGLEEGWADIELHGHFIRHPAPTSAG
jgi:hypothetical protein